MQDIKLVSVDEMETLEQYACSMICSLISLSTFKSFQAKAAKLGILENDEMELSLTISWEIQRLLELYRKQIDQVLSRSEFDENRILDYLNSIGMQIKTKKRSKKVT